MSRRPALRLNDRIPAQKPEDAQAAYELQNRALVAAESKLLRIVTIAWDPSAYIGYSDEQIALIKVGFDHALNQAYTIREDKP